MDQSANKGVRQESIGGSGGGIREVGRPSFES